MKEENKYEMLNDIKIFLIQNLVNGIIKILLFTLLLFYMV